MKKLSGKIAVVAGATRGAGRGIACALGEAGATVYCTGRSTKRHQRARRTKGAPFDLSKRPETVKETAELVTAGGGVGIPVRVDHTVEPGAARAPSARWCGTNILPFDSGGIASAFDLEGPASSGAGVRSATVRWRPTLAKVA